MLNLYEHDFQTSELDFWASNFAFELPNLLHKTRPKIRTIKHKEEHS